MKIKRRHIKMARAAAHCVGRHLATHWNAYRNGGRDRLLRNVGDWHRAAKGKHQ